MNPQDQLMDLLQKHNFDLVRQRKHKIFRNPDGLTFVTASTPSDRKAPQNALSTLKRVLRQANTMQANTVNESSMVIHPPQVVEESPVIKSVSMSEPTMIETAPASISDQEWEAWKRRYWHDEKLRAKNEKFLSMVSICVDRANEIMTERGNFGKDLYLASDAVKSKLRDLHYKSKVLLYNLAIFNQGIAYSEEMSDMPLVWASNGHIGISALVYFNIYVQHEPSKGKTLRFDWDGVPILCELPEERRFLSLRQPQKVGHRLHH